MKRHSMRSRSLGRRCVTSLIVSAIALFADASASGSSATSLLPTRQLLERSRLPCCRGCVVLQCRPCSLVEPGREANPRPPWFAGESTASPALAIRDARSRALRSSRPLPPWVYRDLRRFYPAAVLDRVRFSTDWEVLDATVRRLFAGARHGDAITLDDVIVFRHPGLTWDRWLWAHEIEHVAQAASMGVDRFATALPIWLEQAADNKANQVSRSPISDGGAADDVLSR